MYKDTAGGNGTGGGRSTLERYDLTRRILDLGPWFHNLKLEGIPTAPNHFLGDYPRCKFERFEHALPSDLTGMSVLDVGCNAGFYSIEMKRRGASRVVAIDHDPRYLEQARLASEVLGVELELRQLSAYDVGKLAERFDLVLFLGVLYHLRYPLLALDLLREHAVRDTLVFQTMLRGSQGPVNLRDDYPFDEQDVFHEPGFPKLHFVEHRYTGDSTNWWIPNGPCAEAMLRSAGFRVVQRPEDEVFICGLAEDAWA